MDFFEATAAVEKFTEAMSEVFGNVEIRPVWGPDAPEIGDWSNPTSLGLPVSGDGVGRHCGLYFFLAPGGAIIYIGKATKNNIHHRVWDHLSTPDPIEDGRRLFPRSKFKMPIDADALQCFHAGTARLGLVLFSEALTVSLVEVYLQTLYLQRHGALPALNKQIG